MVAGLFKKNGGRFILADGLFKIAPGLFIFGRGLFKKRGKDFTFFGGRFTGSTSVFRLPAAAKSSTDKRNYKANRNIRVSACKGWLRVTSGVGCGWRIPFETTRRRQALAAEPRRAALHKNSA